jgi:cell division transport system ATP-binding protein
MIRLDSVSLILNKTRILENISFQVGKGELVYLTGPSGAGKSSILKLIHFDTLPTDGTVSVQGFNTRKISGSQRPCLRQKIGFVFQDYKLLNNKTAYDNVAFAMEVTGAKKDVIRQKTLHALHVMGISHRLNHFPRDLSGGECQRIAIARAFVHEPLILLADEPTGNLDEGNSWAIIELLEKINCSGTSVLIATHKTEFTRKDNTRIIHLDRGRLAD